MFPLSVQFDLASRQIEFEKRRKLGPVDIITVIHVTFWSGNGIFQGLNFMK